MASGNAIVRIVARKNGVGLDRDVQLIERALPSNLSVQHRSVRSFGSLRERVLSTMRLDPQADAFLNVLVERVPWAWAYGSGTNVLIPNQERFPHRHLGRLKHVKTVFCKSRHAETIFRKHVADSRFIGFTSVDRQLSDAAPDFTKFLHLAGRSTLKGTAMLLDLWRQNPHWPTLTIVQHPNNASTNTPANVNLIVDYLKDSVLQRMQNEHGVHLCPSLSEGWGHYIVEAMSCAAVVVTTDAPPMNELVDTSRGFPVAWHVSQPRHLGTNFMVDPEAMQRTINDIIATKELGLQQLGQAAREWFEANDTAFMSRASSVFEELAQK